MNGFIKLHRQLMANPIYKNSVCLHVWLHCLLKATHTPCRVLVGRKWVDLKPGQFVTGREKFAQEIGMSPSTARNWLDILIKDGMLDRVSTTTYSLIEVKNWEKYQHKEDSQEDNRGTALGQPWDTYKKGKKGENGKNTTPWAIQNDIEREFVRQGIENPAAYLAKILADVGNDRRPIERAWREWKRGAGIESPGDFYARCKHWHKNPAYARVPS